MLYLANLVKALATILIPAIMQMNLVGMVSTTPQEAVTDFMEGISTGDSTVMAKHMDNKYVNFLVNVEGDDDVVKRMNDALLQNFDYEIENIGAKNDVAVAKIKMENSDFSKVESKYRKEAYDYVIDNLYNDKLSDKKKLNAKCLDIYVKQLEKAAKNKKRHEAVIYVPMVDNGYYGWNIIVTNELMKDILGNFQIPAE